MIKNIKISNFRGLVKLEADFDLVTIFQGENRKGKTSAIRALEWAISGTAVRQNIVKNDTDEARVIVSGDRSIIERSLTQGSSKSKLSAHKITPNGNEPIANVEKILESIFPSSGFDPIKFCFMDNKSRSLLIRNATENRCSMTAEEATSMGFALETTKSAKKQLDEWYDHYYEERRVVNAEIRNFKKKADSATGMKIVSDQDLELQFKVISALEALKVHTQQLEAKANIAKQNAQTLAKLETEKQELMKDLASLADLDLGALDAEVIILKNKFQMSSDEEKASFETIKVLERTLEILGSDKIPVCPISSRVTCQTNMSPVVAELKRELSEKKHLIEELHTLNRGRKILIEEKDAIVKSQANVATKRVTLDRINSMMQSLGSLEQVTVTKPVVDIDNELRQEREKLTLMQVSKNFMDDSNLEDLEKKQVVFDEYVKKIRFFLDNELPKRAQLNIPGITMNDEGIFFRGIPLEDESTSTQVRLALGILRAIYPNISLITVDRLEVMDTTTLMAFIKNCKTQGIQIVGSYVGTVTESVAQLANVKLITM